MMERRLAAILAADVVGYSRLIRADEARTLAALKAQRQELIEPKLHQYHGRMVKLMGDGLLAEFPSAVEAVQCAVEIQQTMAERNADIPDDRRITFRVGINIGDIVVEDDDIYGDGVNVAARLEGLAEPSGICVSRTVFDHVKDKLDLTFEHLGDKEVKNISEPVTVYRISLDEKAAAIVTPVVQKMAVPKRRWRSVLAALVAILVLGGGGVLWWQPWKPQLEPASTESMAFPLPDRPSIAVLPFANLSDNPKEDYFADGITEDLITELSKLRGLFIIAHHSSFAYKGKDADVRQIGRELGVRYILEGSVRRIGERLRINAQLVNAITGDHVWAQRYDAPFIDVFAVQDDILRKIVTELDVTLSEGEQARIWRRTTNNAEAYDLFLRARDILLAEISEEAIHQSIQLNDRALKLDPTFTAALVQQGWNQLNLRKYTKSTEELVGQAAAYARRALEIDDAFGEAYAILAEVYAAQGDMERASGASERSIALNPNSAKTLAYRSFQLADEGKTDEAVEMIKRAMRLNPLPPDWYYNALGYAYLSDGQYEKSIEAFRTCVTRLPEFISCHRTLVAAYMEAGLIDQARAEAKEVLRLNPDFSISAHSFWVNATSDAVERQRRTDLMLKAGLPP